MIQHEAIASVFDMSAIPEAPLTPPEQFAAHVDEVRAQGDVADNRKIFWAKPMGVAAMTSVLPAAVASMDYGIGSFGVPAVLIGAGIIGNSRYRGTRDERYQKQAGASLKEAVQQANDMAYELFALGKKDKREVAMHWLGPTDCSQSHRGVEQLKRVAEMARGAGVEHIVLGNTLSKQIFATNVPGQQRKLGDWLKAKKQWKISGTWAAREIRIATPQDWLDAADDTVRLRTEPIEYTLGGNVLAAGHVGLQEIAKYNNGAAAPAEDGRYYEKALEERRKIIVAEPEVIFPYRRQGLLAELGTGEPSGGQEGKIRTLGRKIGAIAALAAVGFGVALSVGLADGAYKARMDEAKAQIAQEHHLNPDDAIVTDKAKRQRADSWSQLNKVWDGWRTARLLPKRAWDAVMLGGGEDRGAVGMAAIAGRVGNVEDGTNDAPVWHLTPNNMSTRGFWVQSTSNDLDLYNDKESHVALSWDTASLYTNAKYQETLVTFPPNLTDQNGAWIKVDRTIYDGNYITSQKATYIPIPVLGGTAPAAVNWNGRQVQMWQGKNGTWAVMPPPDDKLKGGHVTYWLRKDANAKVMATDDSTFTDVDYTPVNTSVPLETFKKYVPGYKDAKTQDEADKILADYIRNNFAYSFKPLPGAAFQGPKSLDDIAQVMLNARKANCNVANTTVAMQDHSKNGVFGYENVNPENLADLNRNEAHMKLVDKNGNYLDATPPGSEPITNGKPEHDDGSHFPWAPALGLLPLAAAGYGAYRLRRPLARPFVRAAEGLQLARAEAADEELRRMHRYILKGAALAITQAQGWRAEGVSANGLDLARMAANRGMSAEQAYRSLMQPDMHSEQISAALATAPAVTPAMRHAVQLARRANKRPLKRK